MDMCVCKLNTTCVCAPKANNGERWPHFPGADMVRSFSHFFPSIYSYIVSHSTSQQCGQSPREKTYI